MKCLILGDVHACWDDMNITIAKAIREHPDITHIIQVGDLGYGWPGIKPFKASKGFLTPGAMEIYNNASKMWLDGNHENFSRLENDGGAWLPGWTYMPRGSVLGIEDHRLLFYGGAESHDKAHRVEGVSWWPQESINYRHMMETLEKVDDSIDAIFSHEHPASVPYSDSRYGPDDITGMGEKQALEALKEKCEPDFLFFGHHHRGDSGIIDSETNWYCCPIIESHSYTIWTGDTVIGNWQ